MRTVPPEERDPGVQAPPHAEPPRREGLGEVLDPEAKT
jgi:hypothetical protein